MRRSHNWFLSACRVATAYIGTVVGAGFASGQEILRFFTIYGTKSYWAILLSALIFIYMGIMILELGYRLECRSFGGIIQRVFGVSSIVVNTYLAFAMVIISSAMLAGSGALFEEQLGVPFWLGAGITAAIALISISFGVKGILSINGGIVPIILAFNLMVFIFTVIKTSPLTASVNYYIDATPTSLIKAGVSYASFNTILSIGVLAPIGQEIKDKRALICGGVLGGMVLGLMLAISNYCLWAYTPGIFDFEIPFMYVVHRMGSTFFILYAAVIWGGIFTTLIGNLFSISSIVDEKLNIPSLVSSTVILISCLVIASLGFSKIVSGFYPLLGLMGVILIVRVLVISFDRPG